MSLVSKVFLCLILTCGLISSLDAQGETQERTEIVSSIDESGEPEHHGPGTWSVIPFILLLLMIATGPLFYEHFWHKNYPIVSITLGVFIVGYYYFF